MAGVEEAAAAGRPPARRGRAPAASRPCLSRRTCVQQQAVRGNMYGNEKGGLILGLIGGSSQGGTYRDTALPSSRGASVLIGNLNYYSRRRKAVGHTRPRCGLYLTCKPGAARPPHPDAPCRKLHGRFRHRVLCEPPMKPGVILALHKHRRTSASGMKEKQRRHYVAFMPVFGRTSAPVAAAAPVAQRDKIRVALL